MSSRLSRSCSPTVNAASNATILRPQPPIRPYHHSRMSSEQIHWNISSLIRRMACLPLSKLNPSPSTFHPPYLSMIPMNDSRRRTASLKASSIEPLRRSRSRNRSRRKSRSRRRRRLSMRPHCRSYQRRRSYIRSTEVGRRRLLGSSHSKARVSNPKTALPACRRYSVLRKF